LPEFCIKIAKLVEKNTSEIVINQPSKRKKIFIFNDSETFENLLFKQLNLHENLKIINLKSKICFYVPSGEILSKQ